MAPPYPMSFCIDAMLVASCFCAAQEFPCHLECRTLLTLLGMS